MALRNIRVDEDEILRKKSKVVKEITPRTEELIDDMIETVHESNGVGLAAVQVGVLKRICIVTVEPPEIEMPEVQEGEEADGAYGETDGGYEEAEPVEINPLAHNNGEDLVIINPEIFVAPDCEEETDNEGCLSVPGKFGLVTRPYHITLKAFDRNLEPFELEAEGLLARAICHECDHMDGILYTDKVEGELHDVSELMPPEDEDLSEDGAFEDDLAAGTLEEDFAAGAPEDFSDDASEGAKA